MATITDYKLNPPKKKSDLNELSMLAYVKANATPEQKKEFIEYRKSIMKTYKRNMDAANGAFKKGDLYQKPEIGKLRKKFADMFFSDLDLYKKKETKKSTNPTVSDLVSELESEIEA